jgi:hypothetical protein
VEGFNQAREDAKSRNVRFGSGPRTSFRRTGPSAVSTTRGWLGLAKGYEY